MHVNCDGLNYNSYYNACAEGWLETMHTDMFNQWSMQQLMSELTVSVHTVQFHNFINLVIVIKSV